MSSSLDAALSGMLAHERGINLIANNIANVNTSAFKKNELAFREMLYETLKEPGARTAADAMAPTGLQIGSGAEVASSVKIMRQGELQPTSSKFDMAIQGQGFFQILMPDGSTGYTRDGSFQLDSNGQVVTSNGYPLQPAITVPANTQSLTIGSDGTVTATVAGSNTPTQIGTIQLSDFINPAGLQPIGQNLFQETAASGAAQAGTPGLNGLGTVQQGSLETSNVNTVESLVNMIETQRAYEINSKAISTTDQMLQYVNNNL